MTGIGFLDLLISRRMNASRNRFRRIGFRLVLAIVAGASIARPSLAADGDCKADALGVSRIIAVDPAEHPLIGSMQYSETLPLADHEVVITFDDGPSPRYTDRVLEMLADDCVKATFFMVGEMARTFPDEARKVEAQGHTIGTHSFRHPFTFGRMTGKQAGAEIDKGIAAVGAALQDPAALAPFFRVPGFLTSKSTEAALASRRLMTWSADVPADDWKGISSNEIVKRAMARLDAKGRGILLLHDIHENTVAALPDLLKELKEKHFRVVQVVAASSTAAKTVTTPEQWHPPSMQAEAAIDISPKPATSRMASRQVRKARSKSARARTVSRQRVASGRSVSHRHQVRETPRPRARNHSRTASNDIRSRRNAGSRASLRLQMTDWRV
jgi:peptidoglycan/xylan/chitin deacetylase (PgdA/CDA1 family)